jgi:hypothetical protein
MKLKRHALLIALISAAFFSACKDKISDTNAEILNPHGIVHVTTGTFTARTTLVTISSFNIDKYEVTYELWTEVRNWALTHGYTDLVAARNGWKPSRSDNPVTEVN